MHRLEDCANSISVIVIKVNIVEVSIANNTCCYSFGIAMETIILSKGGGEQLVLASFEGFDSRLFISTRFDLEGSGH